MRSVDLMGLGFPPQLSNAIGTDTAAVTAAGTSSGTATAITAEINNVTTAGSQTGVILPALGSINALSPGAMIWVNVTSSTTGVVYPPAGATINGASSLSVAQNKTAVFIYYSSTVIFSILTA